MSRLPDVRQFLDSWPMIRKTKSGLKEAWTGEGLFWSDCLWALRSMKLREGPMVNECRTPNLH